ncbi:hypothetical protein [Paeniglutamicibacter gangotriensis]|uniref:Uncharacterized protein n=1 Tax=Paeniglutamicibacter gangotriensis Lz1y TaxID=1276920 RepID=M7MP71_9MICC|nr:hypothetical protein [Paeniglutamicibacter gangotriensis]EMQ96730.1 hypothetical protein ADIAG_03867 [Paeniglutamicibacter gangotriensis Lz1y]
MEPNEPFSIGIAVPLTPVDENNAAGLERELSEHYFSISPAEYFERRLWEIIKTADTAHQEVRDWHTDDPTNLFNQYATLMGKEIDLDNPPGDTLDSTTMASIESYTLMQHVIETVLRLYVAAKSRKLGTSPMLVLLNMKDPRQLRDPIKELLREEAVLKVKETLLPPELKLGDDPEALVEFEQHILFVTQWLSHFARFYSDDHFGGAQGNNQLKHGAAVAPRADLEYSFLTNIEPHQSLTNEEWNAGTPIINGPSISYMELIKQGGCEPGIRLRTDNSDPATNLAIAAVGISIIKSLWTIAGAVAGPVTGPPRQIDYPLDWSPLPDEVFDKSKRPPRSIVRMLRAPARKAGAQNGAKTKGGPNSRRSRTP